MKRWVSLAAAFALWAIPAGAQTCLVEGVPVICGSQISFTVDATCPICPPPPTCPAPLPAGLPLGVASVFDAASGVDVVGSVAPKNLLINSEALHMAASFGVIVTPRAGLSPSGRPTATLLQATAVSSLLKLADVATTGEVTVSLSVRKGLGHDGTPALLWVYNGAGAFSLDLSLADDWTRHSLLIPGPGPVSARIYPDPTGGNRSVYVDHAQIEAGPVMTPYESTGDRLGEVQISSIRDAVGQRRMSYTAAPPVAGTVFGYPAIVSPAGRASVISLQPVVDEPLADADLAAEGGYTIAYGWQCVLVAPSTHCQFGSFGRGSSLTGPWQATLRDCSDTRSAVQHSSDPGFVVSSIADGIGGGLHFSVISATEGGDLDHWVDAALVQSLPAGEFRNHNWTGPHGWKFFGGPTTSEHSLLWWAVWPRALAPEEVEQLFGFAKGRWAEMPW